MRALWEVAFADRVPDFKREPFELGSFEEIAHHRGARGSRASVFEGGFTIGLNPRPSQPKYATELRFSAAFGDQWSAPSPLYRRYEIGDYTVEQLHESDDVAGYQFATPRGRWRLTAPSRTAPRLFDSTGESIRPLTNLLYELRYAVEDRGEVGSIVSLGGSSEMTTDDVEELRHAIMHVWPRSPSRRNPQRELPFANAPVRSQPQRTYDPRRLSVDPLGEYVPTYLAQLSQRDETAWKRLKLKLEQFGNSAGLFDEIRVRRLGRTDVDPFQIQVRKYGENRLGPFRNLVDVGYGVSQILPVALELLRQGASRTLLLQQPEVHLHPSAQAALGSLLCDTIANEKSRNPRQIVVETHSDFIVDRVRMAIADPANSLTPDDVSLVFFERQGLDANVHSIRMTDSGGLKGVPRGYRRFFLRELQRAIRP